MTKEQCYKEAKECIVRAYKYYNEKKDPHDIQDCISEMNMLMSQIGDEKDVHAQMCEDDYEIAEAVAFVQGFTAGGYFGYRVGVDCAELGREQNEK